METFPRPPTRGSDVSYSIDEALYVYPGSLIDVEGPS